MVTSWMKGALLAGGIVAVAGLMDQAQAFNILTAELQCKKSTCVTATLIPVSEPGDTTSSASIQIIGLKPKSFYGVADSSVTPGPIPLGGTPVTICNAKPTTLTAVVSIVFEPDGGFGTTVFCDGEFKSGETLFVGPASGGGSPTVTAD